MHTFTNSGLGESPFTVISEPSGESIDHLKGQFWCSYCGTILKNRFFIRSKDGIISILGIDCIKKTEDSGLIDGAKQIKKEQRHKQKEHERDVKRNLGLEIERKANNGKTLNELAIENEERRKAIREEIDHQLEEICYEHPVFEALKFNGFGYEMTDIAKSLRNWSKGQRIAIVKCVCRHLSKSRANSKKYNEHLLQAEKLVSDVEKTITKLQHCLD